MKVLITGSSGQLGSEIKELASEYDTLECIFKDLLELDICDTEALTTVFTDQNINAVINCAAYTSVDNAEENTEIAEQVNSIGVSNLIKALEKNNGNPASRFPAADVLCQTSNASFPLIAAMPCAYDLIGLPVVSIIDHIARAQCENIIVVDSFHFRYAYGCCLSLGKQHLQQGHICIFVQTVHNLSRTTVRLPF